ncbi:hypothetical protein BOTNAR_0011g00230 [Botryotinia narcissicola]|uniref:Uncharacterized protein n=1 Tax=Botryotinia narcissicola TaxID=278944 RepID=A0A4Z1JK77_9HELO|nr:hypothetical protein BOTNAR_0011g00230 [Botryotinia narcissicola]
MSSLPLDTFSSEEKFRVYTKIYPLVPGFVLVAWYIEIPNLKSRVSESKKSGGSTAIEATQSVKCRGQHILISDRGILLLSGVLCDRQKMALSTEEDSVLDMLDKDELVVSKEVGTVKGRQIVYFRKTFEDLRVSEEMKKDHTTYIDHVTHELIDAHCFKPKQQPPRRATHKQPSNFNKRKGTRSADSFRSSRSNRSFDMECNEVPPVKQEKTPSAAPKSHKSTEQNTTQVPVEPDHPSMPLTQENLSAHSEGHNSQAGPLTHRSSRSNPDLERNHHNSVQIMKSTDGNNEVKAAPSKRSHSSKPRVVFLYSAKSDPGVDPESASRRSDMSSSNSGRRSSIASLNPRPSGPSSLSRSKDSFHLNVRHHDVNVSYGSSRKHPASSSDDDKETIVNIKLKGPKYPSKS